MNESILRVKEILLSKGCKDSSTFNQLLLKEGINMMTSFEVVAKEAVSRDTKTTVSCAISFTKGKETVNFRSLGEGKDFKSACKEGIEMFLDLNFLSIYSNKAHTREEDEKISSEDNQNLSIKTEEAPSRTQVLLEKEVASKEEDEEEKPPLSLVEQASGEGVIDKWQIKKLWCIAKSINLSEREVHLYVASLIPRDIHSVKAIKKNEYQKVIDFFQSKGGYDKYNITEEGEKQKELDKLKNLNTETEKEAS